MIALGAGLILLVGCVAAFTVVARKGRELRRNQPLPPPAEKAYLRWQSKGRSNTLEVTTPFYIGRNAECQIVLPSARAEYESCIFYHHSRFAFQTLAGGGPILVNGEEKLAGYLWDGDSLEIAQQKFQFQCY